MPTDEKISQLINNTSPVGSDFLALVDSGTLQTQEIQLGDLNLLPEGWMYNGKLSPTIGSNNLTLAIKTKAGGDPSASDPVSVWIGGSFRRITSALSVTINAGTNTFNAGGAELAAKDIDFFPYLSFKTSAGALVLLVSRIPYARLYSEFSTTATDDHYAAYSSQPASTDDCVVIGRFRAQLSAAAAYNWSIPTSAVINRPIYETDECTYTPVFSAITVGNGTLTGKYKIVGRHMFFRVALVFGSTSAMADSFCSVPITPASHAGLADLSQLGGATFYDQSAPAIYHGALVYDAGRNVYVKALNASGTYLAHNSLSTTIPMTWATNDQYVLNGNIAL